MREANITPVYINDLLFRYIRNPYIEFSAIDNYKTDYQSHQKFIDLIDIYAGRLESNLSKNIIEVVKICLNYDPLKRLSAKELLVILKNLNKKVISEIKEEYESIRKMRKRSKTPEYYRCIKVTKQ